ncbi:hypothetical protein V5799_015627 [Amblyomma americanum]|uniref:Uncharacterized protein n=1 Tax=Amblyomma americanum TaxID=6943 RepID=A0AAQ4F7B1_AMBAM
MDDSRQSAAEAAVLEEPVEEPADPAQGPESADSSAFLDLEREMKDSTHPLKPAVAIPAAEAKVSPAVMGTESTSTADIKMVALPSPALKSEAEPALFGPAAKSRPSPLKQTSATQTDEERAGTECKMQMSPSMPSTSGLSTIKPKRPRERHSSSDESDMGDSRVPAGKVPKLSTSPDSESLQSTEAEPVAAFATAQALERPERPGEDEESTCYELSDSRSSSGASVSTPSGLFSSQVDSSGIFFTFQSEPDRPVMDEEGQPSPPILIAGPPSLPSDAATSSERADFSDSTNTNGCFRPGDPNESLVPLPWPASTSGSSSSWDPTRRPGILRPIPLYPSATTSTSSSLHVPSSTRAGVSRSLSYPEATTQPLNPEYYYRHHHTEHVSVTRPLPGNIAPQSVGSRLKGFKKRSPKRVCKPT